MVLGLSSDADQLELRQVVLGKLFEVGIVGLFEHLYELLLGHVFRGCRFQDLVHLIMSQRVITDLHITVENIRVKRHLSLLVFVLFAVIVALDDLLRPDFIVIR